MEVWSSSSSSLEEVQQKAADQTKGTWAPLEQYVNREVEALPLTSPVFTGVSLHYRSVNLDRSVGWEGVCRVETTRVSIRRVDSSDPPSYFAISSSEYLGCWYSVAIDWIKRRAILQTAEEVRGQTRSNKFSLCHSAPLTSPLTNSNNEQMTGPWDATPVYDIPPPFNGTAIMAYTGKAHPEVRAGWPYT